MNYTGHRRLQLSSRNEGKIKSYESCNDVRAWSHDSQTRDRYFRDWIKCDMPVCVVPVSTLSSILSMMTCRSRGRVVYRCHSGCQSKVLLDRLCSSCTAIKDCISNNREFEKYFIEEELETNRWPCEKCLEILKSIKMFWKIVTEKVLKINVSRPHDFKCTHICSLRNIAREWQKEMVEEATFVKSNAFLLTQNDIISKGTGSNNTVIINRENRYFYNHSHSKETETDCVFRNMEMQTDCKSIRQKKSNCTSGSIKMENLEPESKELKDNEVIMIYKNNIQKLQKQFDLQKNEVDRLKKENITLNVELERFRHTRSKSALHGDAFDPIENTIALLSDSINSIEKDDLNQPKDIDSEMIITLKNCKNENFRHISVIQVQHKTNDLNLPTHNAPCYKKEDPLHILNKVHQTFESILKREISIASKTNKSLMNKNVVIKTAFNDIPASKSPSSGSSSCYSVMSECIFESANETYVTSVGSAI